MNSRINYILGVLLVLAIGLSVFAAPLQAQDDLSQAEQNIELARRAINEVFNGGAGLTEETVAEIFAPFFPFHGGDRFGNVTNVGTSGTTTWFSDGVLDTWPDFQVQIEHIFAEGDLVIVHTTQRGTFEGYINQQNRILPGTALEPDGEQHEWEFVYMFRFEDGKIVEQWDFWNTEMIAAVAP